MSTETANLIQTLATLFTALAAIFAAVIAFKGLKTWQSQLLGKNEYELARRLLFNALNLEEAISNYRNPAITQSELSAALQEFGEQNTDSNRNNELVYKRRWIQVANYYHEFSLAGIEAEVLWGEEIEKIVGNISECVNELHLQTTLYLYQTSPDNQKFFNEEGFRKSEKTIYKMPDDEYGNFLHDQIENLKGFLRPKITFQKMK